MRIAKGARIGPELRHRRADVGMAFKAFQIAEHVDAIEHHADFLLAKSNPPGDAALWRWGKLILLAEVGEKLKRGDVARMIERGVAVVVEQLPAELRNQRHEI